MKIEKAIEIKLQWRKDGYPSPQVDEIDADMQSIEALKRIVAWRNDNDEDLMWDLLGETEE